MIPSLNLQHEILYCLYWLLSHCSQLVSGKSWTFFETKGWRKPDSTESLVQCLMHLPPEEEPVGEVWNLCKSPTGSLCPLKSTEIHLSGWQYRGFLLPRGSCLSLLSQQQPISQTSHLLLGISAIFLGSRAFSFGLRKELCKWKKVGQINPGNTNAYF